MLGSLIVLIGLSAGCGKRNEYVPPPPPDVAVSQPVRDNVTEYAEFTGTTRASQSVEIRSRVQGYLQSVHFMDGAEVKKEKLLFVIDPRPFKAKWDAAKADLESKKATVVRTDAIYQRTLALLSKRSASREDAEVQKGNWEVAKADRLEAEAKVREAKLNLDYTEIRAPISGHIGRRQIDVGNLVTADSTLLTSIAQYDPMDAYFNISEGDLLRFRRRGRAEKSPPKDTGKDRIPLDLGLADEAGYPHKGYVDFAAIGVDPDTGTYEARGKFPNPEPYVLLPGLFVRIRGAAGTQEGALLVSERALGSDQQGKFVLVVTEENVVERRQVEVGIVTGGMCVIAKGLQPGEWVIINGLQRARPGDKVNPKRVQSKRPASDR
jgi:RND family efflux transporter MFP subunit